MSDTLASFTVLRHFPPVRGDGSTAFSPWFWCGPNDIKSGSIWALLGDAESREGPRVLRAWTRHQALLAGPLDADHRRNIPHRSLLHCDSTKPDPGETSSLGACLGSRYREILSTRALSEYDFTDTVSSSRTKRWRMVSDHLREVNLPFLKITQTLLTVGKFATDFQLDIFIFFFKKEGIRRNLIKTNELKIIEI